jgi:pimeloyl-ACP methyl ester carboxylesterase
MTIMKMRAVLSIACAGLSAPSPAQAQIDPAVAELGNGFVSRTADVNGTTLHYVRGGAGPAVILLHGFPQDWYEFHEVMPPLAQSFSVIAVDLRGIGGSKATPDGYDAANMAKDVRQLAQELKLERAYLVGHDIGGIVAYAFAGLYPEETRGVMVLDVPLPGIEPWQEVKADPLLWHINFHQTPELPEKLIAGRQAVYFRHFFGLGTVEGDVISDDDAAHYVSAYAAPEQLHAALEMYRAMPAGETFDAAPAASDLPLVLAGGDHGFGTLMPGIAEALRTRGWTDVSVELIGNSGHYVADEQPEALAALIERYASR